MTRIERDLELLKESGRGEVVATPMPSGAHLIEVKNYRLVPGWSQETATILFVAPPAFPAAQPDCFWVEPVGLRLSNGETPQNSNDSNPIPEVGQRGTWFSWHVQEWDPNRHTLLNYFKVIEGRLNPPR